MAFVQKLDILMKKPIDKAVVEEIRKGRWKEREDKWFKRRIDTSIDQMVQKVVDKCVKNMIWYNLNFNSCKGKRWQIPLRLSSRLVSRFV